MREPKTWVFGDVHGGFKALLQIFERAPLQDGDTVISLGDIADGWSETFECVEFLLSLKSKYNMIFIKGNHDDWFLEWLKFGVHGNPEYGGYATISSYTSPKNYEKNRIEHLKFFEYQEDFYLDDKGNLFVHGGFNRHFLLEEQYRRNLFYWDRDLWHTALSYAKMPLHEGKGNRADFKIKDTRIKQIFLGHTATTAWETDMPMHACNIWNLDTGAGFWGKLTIMDVDTHEYWQSDHTKNLYANETGRK